MRAIILIIDSFGIGELPDAKLYNDEGANTALHISKAVNGVKWPFLQRLGLGNASQLLHNNLLGCEPVKYPLASFGVMTEKSPGKDTTTGHWEIAGIELTEPFTVFPPKSPSFPKELTDALTLRTNRTFLGNKAVSGTKVIEELGEEHITTGKPIIYTSSDSVFQIAAHEDVIPLKELYSICKHARELCNPYQVGRIIARPFLGTPGKFVRTAGRKDYSIQMTSPSIMDHLQQSNIKTIGIGKISDIFCNKGLDVNYPDKGNTACMQRTEELLSVHTEEKEFIFINLVDTDMLYGHRRNAQGYHDEVVQVDAHIGKLLNMLTENDLLIITADHGCDPTFKGTDHTREYIPLLSFQKNKQVSNLGIRDTFSDIASSISDFFQCGTFSIGKSFYKK